MNATNRLTPGDLIVLLAETDEKLAYWRIQAGHAYRQQWIDAYLARRYALAKKLAQRTKTTSPVPA